MAYAPLWIILRKNPIIQPTKIAYGAGVFSIYPDEGMNALLREIQHPQQRSNRGSALCIRRSCRVFRHFHLPDAGSTQRVLGNMKTFVISKAYQVFLGIVFFVGLVASEICENTASSRSCWVSIMSQPIILQSPPTLESHER